MKYRLYHSTDFRATCMADMEDVLNAWAAGDYQFVGYIDGESLNDVFSTTQNIEESWTSRVPAHQIGQDLRANGCRSTSVGDIIMGDNDEKYVVAMFGFKPL